MKNKQEIAGHYNFTINIFTMFNVYACTTKLNKNLITSKGEKFFTSKWVDSTSNEILSKIVVGKGTKDPAKIDTSLFDKTAELATTIKNNISNIQLVGEMNGSEINDTTEIGVITNKDNLVSRDVHKPIQVPYSSNVTINYYYTLQIGVYKAGWTSLDGYDNVYWVNEPETVNTIVEIDTGSGYVLKGKTEISSTIASYCQINDKLYIHTSDNINPNSHDLLVNYKGA